MKKNILISGLTLASLLLALSGINSEGRNETESNSDQTKASQTESSKKVPIEKQSVYDIDGKRVRADEKYLADITTENGRITVYRKNKREIAALVKALKENGVTDKKLLNPNTWVTTICDVTAATGCIGGCSPTHRCKRFKETIHRVRGGVRNIYYSYCFCVP